MTASNMISVIVAIFFVVSIGLGDTPLLYYAATSSDPQDGECASLSPIRPMRSGPFEPFTLVHVGSYAADIQHSGEAIADQLKSSFRHHLLQFPHLRVGRRYGRREGPRCGRTSFEGLRVWPDRFFL